MLRLLRCGGLLRCLALKVQVLLLPCFASLSYFTLRCSVIYRLAKLSPTTTSVSKAFFDVKKALTLAQPERGKLYQPLSIIFQLLSPTYSVCRAKVHNLSGCESHPAKVVPAGSNRNGRGGNEPIEASGVEGP